MKRPTEILRDEHTLIVRALDVLDAAVERREGPDAPGESWWQELLGWLRAVADRTHHRKEEDLLFPAMVRAGVPGDGGPVGVMLEEHAEGRRLIAAMTGAGPPARAAAGRAYSSLLRAHIDKENDVLFPLADELLDAATQRALAARFEEEGSLGDAEAVLEGLGAALSARCAPASRADRTSR